jgi:HK97 gp10 family phage protein
MNPTLGRELAVQVHRDAVRGIAHEINQVAQMRAPVDTGRLRLHIQVQQDALPEGLVAEAKVVSYAETVPPSPNAKSYTYPEGNTTPGDYASFVHWGTRHMHPRPYLTEATVIVAARHQ